MGPDGDLVISILDGRARLDDQPKWQLKVLNFFQILSLPVSMVIFEPTILQLGVVCSTTALPAEELTHLSTNIGSQLKLIPNYLPQK